MEPAPDADPRHQLTADVHLILLEGNRVLCGRRQNTCYKNGTYYLPSGHLKVDESVVAALVREAKEEIGITI